MHSTSRSNNLPVPGSFQFLSRVEGGLCDNVIGVLGLRATRLQSHQGNVLILFLDLFQGNACQRVSPSDRHSPTYALRKKVHFSNVLLRILE